MIFEQSQPNGIQHEEENYFVSMTDMMVGVLFIFIIMLMVFALDFRSVTDTQERISTEQLLMLKKYEQLLAQTKRKNLALERKTRRISKKLDALQKQVRREIQFLADAQKVRSGLLRDIRRALEHEGLRVEIDETNGVLRLTEDAVRFETDRSDLVGEARGNVGKIARALALVLPKYAHCTTSQNRRNCRTNGRTTVETVFIEGHTDKRGSDERNWKLSTQRAVNTYRVINETRPRLHDLINRAGRPIISVSGYASNRPIDKGVTPQAYERNRRIDLRFVMETDQKGRLGKILKLTNDMRKEVRALREAVER